MIQTLKSYKRPLLIAFYAIPSIIRCMVIGSIAFLTLASIIVGVTYLHVLLFEYNKYIFLVYVTVEIGALIGFIMWYSTCYERE